MTFALTESQTLIAQSLDRLLGKESSFEVRRRRGHDNPGARSALWPLLAENGVLAVALPESAGGLGGGIRDLVVVMEMMGKWLTPEPVLAAAVCSQILQRVTDTEWARDHLARLISGETTQIFAHAETLTPFASPATRAVRVGDGFRLQGSKVAVRHADAADTFLVSALLDGDSALFMVDARHTDAGSAHFRLIDGSRAATLELRNCPARLLLNGEAAAQALGEAIDWWLVGLAAETSGIVRRLNAATFEHLRTRKQFGAALATFQVLQHRAVGMHIAAEQAQVVIERAVEAIGSGASSRSAIASAAKAVGDDAGRVVGHDATQLHGAMGVSDELDISHYMRRLAAIRAEAGQADIHRARFQTQEWIHVR